MKKTVTTFLSITLLSLLISCKGDKGEVGPAGKDGRDEDSWTYKEGFVKGQASGVHTDGTEFNYSFNFQGNQSPFSNSYIVSSEEEMTVSVDKLYSGEGDPFIYGELQIVFSVPDLNTLEAPEPQYFFIELRKDLGNGKYFLGNNYYSSGSQSETISVSDLSYNSSTRVLTGSYSASFPSTNSRGSLNVSGTFSTILNQTVAKVGQTIE